MTKILPIVMCGGSGTRMWPESRESYPKQFIGLFGGHSTFQGIVRLLADPAIFEKPIVLTNSAYRFRVAEQLAEIGVEADIVLEPMGRDSGPAVAAAAVLAARRAPDAIAAVLAADHVFARGDVFVSLCARAAEAAKAGVLVTFGVKPDHPAIGYGYIRSGEPLGGFDDVHRVEKFVEKPNEAKAVEFVAAGYVWNSGNFMFRADVMLDEIRRFEPEMASAAEAAVDKAKPDLAFLVLDGPEFAKAPKKSIDYAVMERTDKAAVIAADVGWSDVGQWSTVRRLSTADAQGNVISGKAVALDSRNVMIRSPDRLTAVVGLDDVVVVTTADAVLVSHADATDKVKQLVAQIAKEGRPEATEHLRAYRPWGWYQSVDRGERHQVKRIVVKSGQRLSLQKHHHRAEHWIVVRGTAEVTLDQDVRLVHENESIYLPIGCVHRLANPGKIPLEIIEVQTGSYLGEDDIIRIEDVYNRS